jgi:hypothetical protein
MRKKLEQEVKKIDKKLKRGDRIELLYDGEEIARYDYFERSIDCKTPLQWLRGCFVFEIDLKGRDISKVALKHNKAINLSIGNCGITII